MTLVSSGVRLGLSLASPGASSGLTGTARAKSQVDLERILFLQQVRPIMWILAPLRACLSAFASRLFHVERIYIQNVTEMFRAPLLCVIMQHIMREWQNMRETKNQTHSKA